MKSLLLAGGVASGLVVAMVALPVPAVAAEMCQGRAATLVGGPDMSLVGTEGDDVIVTKGSRVVLALGGNDRVCVTGKSGQVYAGFGDDVVDTTTASSGRSFLGPGADTYLGGPGPDFVKAAGNPGTGAAIGDQEVDVIDVGAGPATIYSGAPGKGNADTITVGDGPSTVNWSGFQTGGEVEFGSGRHRMQVFLKGDEPRDWRLGNGLVSDSGDQLVRWTGVVRELSVLAFPDVAALTMLGSAAPELLKARACRVTIQGRGGNDLLRFSLAPDGCQRHQRRLLGGAGADTLLGSPRGDVLLGGGGHDVADGRRGNDRCRAEVRRHCERR